MKVFENKAMREIFRRKMSEVTEDWGNWHDERLYVLTRYFRVII